MLEAIRVIPEQMAMINVDHWKFPIHARAIGANSVGIIVGWRVSNKLRYQRVTPSITSGR
jgi:hypothetical protein